MQGIVMEGRTPPQKARVPGRPAIYPFEELKEGESFLVSTAGLSKAQAERKYHILRTRKWKVEQKLSCTFSVTFVEGEDALRVRRDS